jgi:phosphate:Na+ symporter
MGREKMDFFAVLSMIGGLALFLFGMDFMGANLSKASGGKLESVLEKLTSNPIKAVLLGAGVTAVIQSSSATTVMVVGFVNSGVMKLSQAAGIIMGANVGTTVTSWLLSLTGIQSGNFIIKLLKPSSFSPILAMLGIILYMFSKQEKKKNIGGIFIGFAVLMTGMEAMSAAVAPLRDVPEFTGMLTMFSNPILGMFVGAVLTAIIQSSSASVGILQALCATGAVSYGTAIPIIMGQNIGTCVTAMLSSVGASKNAKRAACIHLYFNVIGTAIFMVVFYAINVFYPFAFLNGAANSAGIAVVHSLFNIGATVLLLPFVKQLEWLATKTIKDKPQSEEEEGTDQLLEKLHLLDVRFLEQPSLAMEHCRTVTNHMAKLSEKALLKAMHLLEVYDEAEAEKVKRLEDAVDVYEDELGKYMIQLSSREISEKDSYILSVLLHSINDLERICDHAVNIMESAQQMHQMQMQFSESASREMAVLCKAITEIVHTSIQVLADNDKETAVTVEPLEEAIDNLSDKMRSHHIERLKKGSCSAEIGFILMNLTVDLERVSDHCSNLAVSVMKQGITYLHI